MLEKLIIKNIAIIVDIEVEFNGGLNILTGETGAGKSIIIDSIGFLLGDRADKSLIRSGEKSCKVIGKFSVDKLSIDKFYDFCNKYDLEKSDEIIISRSFNIDGKSDVRVNGEIVTLNTLRELSEVVINIYGQNDNQLLFNVQSQMLILDSFCDMTKNSYYKLYLDNFDELKHINQQIKELGGSEYDRAKTMDFLKYQIDEIVSSKISSDEYENLLDKKHRLSNIGKIVASTTDAQNVIEQNVLDGIVDSCYSLEQAENYDPSLTSFAERLRSMKIEIQDILSGIMEYNENSNFSEEEQQQIEDRLSLYNSLFRKYGLTVADILAKLKEYNSSFEMLNNAKEQLELLFQKKHLLLNLLFDYGKILNKIRVDKSQELCEKLSNNLKQLSIKNAKVEFQFSKIEFDEEHLYPRGMDKCELLFSANLGETLKPLSKIASGGEISRFMLALKSIVAAVDNMPTMIFDEIDSGISGLTSEAVAKHMAIISRNHQVIVITHSHQIASMGDYNYLIYKIENNGKTETQVKLLDKEQKINEIARFMAGSIVTKIALDNAKCLIEEQSEFKNSLLISKNC